MNWVSGWILTVAMTSSHILMDPFGLYRSTVEELGHPMRSFEALKYEAFFPVLSLLSYIVFVRPRLCFRNGEIHVRNPVRTFQFPVSNFAEMAQGFWFAKLVLVDGRSIQVFAMEETLAGNMLGDKALDRVRTALKSAQGNPDVNPQLLVRTTLFRDPIFWLLLGINLTHWLAGMVAEFI